jgi:hypothetical protein
VKLPWNVNKKLSELKKRKKLHVYEHYKSVHVMNRLREMHCVQNVPRKRLVIFYKFVVILGILKLKKTNQILINILILYTTGFNFL